MPDAEENWAESEPAPRNLGVPELVYNPEPQREGTRSDLAKGLLYLLTFMVGGVLAFIGFGLLDGTALTQSIFPSVVTLVGTALGFYFGTRQSGESQSQNAANLAGGGSNGGAGGKAEPGAGGGSGPATGVGAQRRVAITEPAQGASLPASAGIAIAAEVVGAGKPEKVQFYDGATLLAETQNSPYRFEWTGAQAGQHSLKAVAVYGDGRVESDPVTITVTP